MKSTPIVAEPGMQVSDICLRAAEEAARLNGPVTMIFNGTSIMVEPEMSAEWISERWWYVHEVKRLRAIIEEQRAKAESAP